MFPEKMLISATGSWEKEDFQYKHLVAACWELLVRAVGDFTAKLNPGFSPVSCFSQQQVVAGLWDSCLLLAVREQHTSCMGERGYLKVPWKATGDRAHSSTPHCLPAITRCLDPAASRKAGQTRCPALG